MLSSLKFLCWLFLASSGLAQENPEEYLDHVNQTFTLLGNKEMEARWNYITNITQENEEAMVHINSSP